jgi:hypothetical protein
MFYFFSWPRLALASHIPIPFPHLTFLITFIRGSAFDQEANTIAKAATVQARRFPNIHVVEPAKHTFLERWREASVDVKTLPPASVSSLLLLCCLVSVETR